MDIAKRLGMLGLVMVLMLAASVVTGQGKKTSQPSAPELPRRIRDYDDCEKAIEELLDESEGLEFEDGEYLVEDEQVTLSGDDVTDPNFPQPTQDLGTAENLIMCGMFDLQPEGEQTDKCGFYAHVEVEDDAYQGSTWVDILETSVLEMISQYGFAPDGDEENGNYEWWVIEDLLEDPPQLIMVIYDGFAWVYVNGELYIAALPLKTGKGTFGVRSWFPDRESECEISDLWVYAE